MIRKGQMNRPSTKAPGGNSLVAGPTNDVEADSTIYEWGGGGTVGLAPNTTDQKLAPATIIYMAGPIDLAPFGSHVFNWRKHLVDSLGDLVHMVGFNPLGAFHKGDLDHPQISQYINTINETARKLADVTLAYMPRHIPSIGTPVEVERSREAGKPLIVVTNLQVGQSIVLDGLLGQDVGYATNTPSYRHRIVINVGPDTSVKDTRAQWGGVVVPALKKILGVFEIRSKP